MEVRKVSSKGQLTLPKEFAGKLVCVERLSESVVQIKAGKFVPDSEVLFHMQKYKKRLKKFDQWMDKHEPSETNLEELIRGKQK